MNFLMRCGAVCFLLLLAILKCSCQKYFRQEHLDSNLCGNQRTFFTFIMQTVNKYEIPFNREVNSIVLEKRWNATTAKRLKGDCTFKIDTKKFGKNSGIYVNILKMRLRQKKPTNECIDSIVVKHNDDVKRRFCGELPLGEIRTIEDYKGKVKITVSIDTSKPMKDDEVIEFQIVATAFKDCTDLEHEINCRKNVRRSCISSSFANDTVINCPEPSCSDERYGCITSTALSNVLEEPTVNNNLPQIFLSAITSLLLTMLCCGGCFVIVFKIKRCLNPPPVSATTTRVHRRRRRNNQSDTENPTSSQDASPSAPPVDKDDLPPSYDALFPEGPKQEEPTT